MTFDGTWKIDRNDNYEKFMEKMGEWCQNADKCLFYARNMWSFVHL